MSLLSPKNPVAAQPSTAAPRRVLPGSIRSTKSQIVSAQLEELAARLGTDAKLPRMTDLCAELNVSITTLIAALNDLEARGVLRRKHGVGIFVAPKLHQANIMLLCDSDFFSRNGLSPFWGILVNQARERAEREALGFELHFAEPPYAPRTPDAPFVSDSVAKLIDNGRVQGVVAVGVAGRTSTYLEQQGIPLVAFAGKGSHVVMVDIEDLVRQGVQALARAGAKRIALWSPMQTFVPREETFHPNRTILSAFQSGLEEVGLPFIPELVRQNEHQATEPGSHTEKPYKEQGYETALSVFGADNSLLPDAIVSPDDMLTSGALPALRRCGVAVRHPAVSEDAEQKPSVLFASHANVGSNVLIGDEDSLYLIQVDPAEVVQTLFTLLEELMQGNTEVPVRTIIRTSRKEPRPPAPFPGLVAQ